MGEVKELKYVKDVVVATADKIIKDAGIDMKYEVGTMIEIPRAALTADEIAKEAEFFCFGTNDLTQYIMAADRGNSTVAKLVDYCNDAVINAIAMVCQAGRNNEIPVSMCGEMAGDIQQTARLLTMGIDKLSASPSRLPALKAAIRISH